MESRRLTAQEALEQEGYVVYSSDKPESVGTAVESARTSTGVPHGAKMFLLDEISLAEAIAFGVRVGWNISHLIRFRYFYKAVAE